MHMYGDGGWFLGMHFFWWLFWLILIAVFFWLVAPTPRRRSRPQNETALEILQRRYAAGEISTQDYEERKARLERDRPTSG